MVMTAHVLTITVHRNQAINWHQYGKNNLVPIIFLLLQSMKNRNKGIVPVIIHVQFFF